MIECGPWDCIKFTALSAGIGVLIGATIYVALKRPRGVPGASDLPALPPKRSGSPSGVVDVDFEELTEGGGV